MNKRIIKKNGKRIDKIFKHYIFYNMYEWSNNQTRLHHHAIPRYDPNKFKVEPKRYRKGKYPKVALEIPNYFKEKNTSRGGLHANWAI